LHIETISWSGEKKRKKKNPAGHHHNCQVCHYHHPALYLSPVLPSFPISFNGFARNPSAATQIQPWRKKFPGEEIQALDYFNRAPTMLPFGLYNCLVFPWALCLNTHYTETFCSSLHRPPIK